MWQVLQTALMWYGMIEFVKFIGKSMDKYFRLAQRVAGRFDKLAFKLGNLD